MSYVCRHCAREFDKAAALGGHVANLHPKVGTLQAQAQSRESHAEPVQIEYMSTPHDFTTIDVVRQNTAMFGIPAVVFLASSGALILLPLNLALPFMVFVPLLTLAGVWFMAARSMVSEVLILRVPVMDDF